MNKTELLNLFARPSEDSPLFAILRQATERIEASNGVRIVEGGLQRAQDLVRTYAARLRRSKERNKHVPGLEETVRLFYNHQGSLRGGYAETDTGLIYFWLDEQGNVAGCIL